MENTNCPECGRPFGENGECSVCDRPAAQPRRAVLNTTVAPETIAMLTEMARIIRHNRSRTIDYAVQLAYIALKEIEGQERYVTPVEALRMNGWRFKEKEVAG